MKALIFKEWREHLKWVPLPGLVILLVFSIEKPEEPMPWSTAAYYYCLTAVVFAAALGFLQIVFSSARRQAARCSCTGRWAHAHLPGQALAGVSLYLLALGIPFVCLETWKGEAGQHAGAPYHWRMSLPWLADILSGLDYFAGMLMAHARTRWCRQPGFGPGSSLLLLLPGRCTARILASTRSDRDYRVVCGRGGAGQLSRRVRPMSMPASFGWPRLAWR